MGLFRSILKPFKSIFGGLGKTLVGSPDKVKWIDPRKMIAPPSPIEKGLSKKLYSRALFDLNRADWVSQLPLRYGDFLSDAMNQHNTNFPLFLNWSKQIGNILNQTFAKGINSIPQISTSLDKSYKSAASKIPYIENTVDKTFFFSLPKIALLEDSLRKTFAKSQESISPVNNKLNQAYNFSVKQLIPISKGELPESFKETVNQFFKSQVGGILNRMSKRGIVNSSVTQKAISDAASKALNLQVQYLPLAANMATMPFKLSTAYAPLAAGLAKEPFEMAMRYSPLAVNMATMPFKLSTAYAPLATGLAKDIYDFSVYKPIGLFSILRDIEKDYLQMPSNMWAQLMNARYGVRAMPVVQRGNGGLLGAIMPSLGGAIGTAVGGPIGGFLGSKIGGFLNKWR